MELPQRSARDILAARVLYARGGTHPWRMRRWAPLSCPLCAGWYHWVCFSWAKRDLPGRPKRSWGHHHAHHHKTHHREHL